MYSIATAVVAIETQNKQWKSKRVSGILITRTYMVDEQQTMSNRQGARVFCWQIRKQFKEQINLATLTQKESLNILKGCCFNPVQTIDVYCFKLNKSSNYSYFFAKVAFQTSTYLALKTFLFSKKVKQKFQ